MHLFYLHGFASSARSSKATFLSDKLRELGLVLHAPDFNEPDFSSLTITRMIEQVQRGIDALPAAPVALIGSSLGAFIAVQVAMARPADTSHLVLLAPALDLAATFEGPSASPPAAATSREAADRLRNLGQAGLDEWRRTNSLNVFHYGYGRMMTIKYDLYDDLRRYDAMDAELTMPIQVFQGRFDDAVDPITVERWARVRSNAELHMLDDDHQLKGSLDYIWGQMRRFLSI